MKIAVFGVGAMGSIYAGLLADAGHEVWAIDIWQNHLDTINTNGLRVEGASGDRIVKSIRASTDAKEASLCDLYIIATKASGVGPAANAIASVMGSRSIVLTIQNGLGAGERIAQYIPVKNVLLGVADGFGASMKGPGHAHHNAMKLIRIGEMDGRLTDRLRHITTVWQHAGFETRAFSDISQLIWEKFICNCTYSAACTVFECNLQELMERPERFNLALGCAREVYALGLAQGIVFSFDDPLAYVKAFGESMPHAKPSMLLDHQAERMSEIGAINGMAVELGNQLQIPVPYNETLTAIVRGKEEKFV